jgi:hypothetical protein
MIKFLAYSAISLMLVNAAAAQTADEGASLGVKAGVNSAHFSLQDASAKASPGFNIGLSAARHFQNMLPFSQNLI